LNLTAAQQSCLESKIGKPGEGTPPTRDQMDSAFSSCGISAPASPPTNAGGPQLTDAQKNCVEGIVGKPGENGQPSAEEMQSAFKTCGIQAPDLPQSQKHRAPVADQNEVPGSVQ